MDLRQGDWKGVGLFGTEHGHFANTATNLWVS